MITIEEVVSLLDQFQLCGVGSTEHAHLIEAAEKIANLAISQHEEIESLKTLLREVEALSGAERGNICVRIIRMKDEIERLKRERDDAYERAAQVCDTEHVAPGQHFAACVRALKSGEPK